MGQIIHGQYSLSYSLSLKAFSNHQNNRTTDDNNQPVEGTGNAFLSLPLLSENLGRTTAWKCLDVPSVLLANTSSRKPIAQGQ